MSFPGIFVLIILTTLLRNSPVPFISQGIWPVVLVIAFLAWMRVARIVRASFLSIKEMSYVEAARSIGSSNGRIMWRHILPNSMGPIIVAGTLRVATSIVSEAGLSFLGFGVQPPTPTWGNMLKNAQSLMLPAPWVAIFPGAMIFITVLGLNYVGDGLRDALDPQSDY
jgi:peptide/nickel transport system permease protein